MARLADLLSVEDARERILQRFDRLPGESVSLAHILGRVLVEAVQAPMDLPPFANSSMDGFAVSSATTADASRESPVRLRVGPHIPAGSEERVRLEDGGCARIMTGAPLPADADAVIPFEEVDDKGGEVVIFASVRPGACVRPAGQDTTRGGTVLQPGTVMGARQIAMAAAVGRDMLLAARRPVVGVLSTGDELVAPGRQLRPGQIYNSNTAMLLAAVTEAGASPVELPTSGDDKQAISSAIASLQEADLLITTGGASVGDFDFLKDVVGAEGELSFWRVRVRPGKPLLFGSVGAIPVIGLPGNPTSAMVTFEEFVRPAIQKMLGAPLLRPEMDVVVDERVDNRGGRRTYARVRLAYRSDGFHARLSGPQDSAMILPLASADGLLVVPEDRVEILPGERAVVQVWHLPEPSTE